MRKIIVLCLLAYSTLAVAQKKSVNVDSLIKNKSFVFVVNEIRTQQNLDETTVKQKDKTDPLNVDMSKVSAGQRLYIEKEKVKYSQDYQDQLDKSLLKIDNKYYTLAQKNGQNNSSSNLDNTNAIYLIQNKEQLTINENNAPITISSITRNDYQTLQTNQYELKSAKKKNGKWTLTYSIKKDNKTHDFYVIINSKGEALLSQHSSTLFGFISPIS